MRIGIIGAGSTYTPELIEGLGAGRLGAPVEELVLMDIDAERLGILGGLAERMLRRAGWGGRITLTTERAAVTDGVDACLVQYRIGGSAARVLDESIPLRVRDIVAVRVTGALRAYDPRAAQIDVSVAPV